MSILTAADLAKMQAEIAEVINDNDVSVVLRRKVSGSETTLAAQTVRVERLSTRSRGLRSGGGEERRADIVVIGSTSFDVQKDDRFTYQGDLYRVHFVRPNAQVCIQAEAEIIQ